MDHLTQRGPFALAILLTFLPGQLFAQTEKAKPDPAKVARQKAAAAAHWKRIVEEAPQQFETDHLLLFAPASSKNLADTGAGLEKAFGLAVQALKLSPDELWPGKLTVYQVNERGQYKSFMRSVLRKRAEDEDHGGFQNESEFPSAVGGPPVGASSLKPEQEAASQIAQALLAQKAKTRLPEWLVFGFGRATLLRVSPPALYAAEKRKAQILVAAKKRTSREIWTGSDALLAGEAAILRGSLVDFLAYSGATTKFPEFVTGFRVRDKKDPNPTTETAFTRSDINAETLEKAWRAWLAR